MEKDELVFLLEKYWNAETSVKEEKLLKAYFRNTDYEDLSKDAEWFKEIATASEILPDASHPVSFRPTERGVRMRNRFALKVAAVILLASCIFGAEWYYEIRSDNIAQQIMAKKQIEADLNFMGTTLSQGYESIYQSEKVILNIKSIK